MAAEAILWKYDSVPFAFADDVKRIAYNYYDWDGKKNELGRKLLQDIGTTGRNYNRDIWANKVIDRIRRHLRRRFLD